MEVYSSTRWGNFVVAWMAYSLIFIIQKPIIARQPMENYTLDNSPSLLNYNMNFISSYIHVLFFVKI